MAEACSLSTFPRLLMHNAQRFRDRPAMREKDLGIWQSWSWGEMAEQIRDFSAGLALLGLGPGEKLAIIGDNRPRLYWSIIAAQVNGAVPVPVYADSVAEEMLYILDNADVSVAVVENQEQVDKLLSIRDRLPKLRAIIYDDTRGLRDYNYDFLYAYDSLLAHGAERSRQTPGHFEKMVADVKPEDPSIMLYTSGTTGHPKGVVLSHRNILETAQNSVTLEGLNAFDEILAYLPMAWVGDHIFSFGQSYVAGFCVSCPENSDTVLNDLWELGPTYYFAPPRVFENLLTTVMIRMQDAGRFKQRLFHYFMDHAKKVGVQILDGHSVGFWNRLKYAVGELMIYGPLKNVLGLSRVRLGYTAGEAIGPEIFEFYRALGINLKQLYGMTEASVFVAIQPDGQIKADSVGVPAPGVEIQIADSNEILFRSPGAFIEYFKNPEATRQTKTAEGWVHTGDAGFFDADGHLKIIDRVKDVGILNDGSMFAPKYIENKLKFFPNIKETVCFGHGRDYCAAFINIDLEAVGSWAERNGIAYASYQELAALPAVYAIISDHVADVNFSLCREKRVAGSQIRKFLLLHKMLDADDGELTRTSKLRRGFIEDFYADLIAALYSDATECSIETEITFEDGRKGRMQAIISIAEAVQFDMAGMAPCRTHAMARGAK